MTTCDICEYKGSWPIKAIFQYKKVGGLRKITEESKTPQLMGLGVPRIQSRIINYVMFCDAHWEWKGNEITRTETVVGCLNDRRSEKGKILCHGDRFIRTKITTTMIQIDTTITLVYKIFVFQSRVLK
jgi:hypothetical protein